LIKGSSLGDEDAIVEERFREVEGAYIPRRFISWRERVSTTRRRHTSLGCLAHIHIPRSTSMDAIQYGLEEAVHHLCVCFVVPTNSENSAVYWHDFLGVFLLIISV
jgi:hypothetical protein